MPKRKKRDHDGILERPDSPYWWASYVDGNGQSARRSTGILKADDPQRAIAIEVRARWLAEAYRNERQVDSEGAGAYQFDELLRLYLEGPSKDKRSRDRDHSCTTRLFRFFRNLRLDNLTGRNIRDYIAQRQGDGVANGTINRELATLGAMLNWARRELEWDIPNPVTGRKLKTPASRTRWLTLDEAQRLLAAAGRSVQAPHLKDFIRLGLHTGLRSGEMLGLEWSRVDLQNGRVYLRPNDQKNGKHGGIPLNSEARAALMDRALFRASKCPESSWVFCDAAGNWIASIKTAFRSAVGKAGLVDVHPHDLRRTCGSWLVQAGVSIKEIAALLRHTDIRITDRTYAHLAPDGLRGAVETLVRASVSR